MKGGWRTFQNIPFKGSTYAESCNVREHSKFEEAEGQCIYLRLRLGWKRNCINNIWNVDGAKSGNVYISILNANVEGECQRTLIRSDSCVPSEH